MSGTRIKGTTLGWLPILFWLWPLLISICFLTFAAAQSRSQTGPELIRQSIANELASDLVTQNCSYQYDRQVSGKWETRLMVNSRDLLVGKLIRIDNAPIPPDREEKEDRRLRDLLANPAEQAEQRKQQRRFEDRLRALVQAIPQAFEFTETQTEIGPEKHKWVHFSFRPAADFKPPGTDLEILRGLEGTMVVDATKSQILQFNAHLFRDVDFGWGMLVHLKKAGNLFFQRDPAEGNRSNIRELSLNVNGRIFLLRKLEIHWTLDHFACFREPVALASAVAMLTSPSISLLVPQ
jgi:hypothetical protein